MHNKLYIFVIVLGFTLTYSLNSSSWCREKYEPTNGCYIGAFIENDSFINGDIGLFESSTYTNKKHATYFTYNSFNGPTTASNFPWAFAMRCKKVGAAIHLGWEPNSGWLTNVVDSTYLKSYARDCGLADMPVFLRFASEFNGSWVAWYSTNSQSSSSTYRASWKTVYSRLSADAPNAVMVWTPNTPYPGNGADVNYSDCYPGDDYVQWVGVDLYDVGYHNHSASQAGNENPATQLLYGVYTSYQSHKPIKISEWAANHYDYTLNYDLSTNVNFPLGIDDYFAPTKLHQLYSVVSTNFPRLKAIQYFDYDTFGVADRDYSVTDNDTVLNSYRSEIKNSYFLTSVVPRGNIIYSKSQPFTYGIVTITLTTDRPLLGTVDPKIQIVSLGTTNPGWLSMSSTSNPLIWQYIYQVESSTSVITSGFLDDFEDGNANDGNPANWHLPSGWSVSNDVDSTNKVLISNTSTSTTVGGYDWSDYAIRTQGESQSSSVYIGLIFRYVSSTSFYSLVLRGNANQDFSLLKQTGATSTTLTSVLNPLGVNTSIIEYYPYKFHLECNGSSIRAKIWRKWDIEPSNWQIDYTDPSPIIHGTLGFRTNNTRIRYDDVMQSQLQSYIDGKQLVDIDARDLDNSQTFIDSGRTFITQTNPAVSINDWFQY